MLGYYVDQGTINQMIGQAALQIRTTFSLIEIMSQFLTNHPVVNNVDPLTTDFGYTTDEAAKIRNYFETMMTIKSTNDATFDLGTMFTGLL